MNIVTPKTGEVILFNSGIQHMVETNTSKKPRYSIAFNTFIKGKIGDFRDVSELTL
jgi:ectoine hydroxylase-related dioxygenase (phytanoyl-CoA dioxygenase family)